MIYTQGRGKAPCEMWVQVFMEVAYMYEEIVSDFNRGLSRSKNDARAAEQKTIGSHGGKIPSATEATRIFEEKGMS